MLKAFDEGLLTGTILIDLQKAFDTIDHEILFQNLKAIRFSKGTLQWFRSYPSERIFLVNIKNKLSYFKKISCGVPQGSILGPLLFLIHHKQLNQFYFYYADDLCILYQHKEVHEIEKQLNKDL